MSYSWQQMKRAERGLRALEDLAVLLRTARVDGARAWTEILKPIVMRLVGWSRHRQSELPDGGDVTAADAALDLARLRAGAPATAIEAFLRTSEAYGIATKELLERLNGRS